MRSVLKPLRRGELALNPDPRFRLSIDDPSAAFRNGAESSLSGPSLLLEELDIVTYRPLEHFQLD